MSENRSPQAVPNEGAASPRLREAVTDLREALDLYDWWPENDPLTTTTAALSAAHEVLAAVESRREVCTIRTVEQLDALPDGAIVRESTGAAWHKDGRYSFDEPWWCAGSEVEHSVGAVNLPALLLWHPDWDAS